MVGILSAVGAVAQRLRCQAAVSEVQRSIPDSGKMIVFSLRLLCHSMEGGRNSAALGCGKDVQVNASLIYGAIAPLFVEMSFLLLANLSKSMVLPGKVLG